MDLSDKRLLLIKPSSLGDIVHAVPTAWALKERWPGLHLSWLVNRGFEGLIKPVAAVDETVPFDRNRFRGLAGTVGKRRELRSFTRQLREADYDVVLDMQGLFRSGMFAWTTRAKLRVGEASARECAGIFYNRKVKTPAPPVHARERYAALARALGCESPVREDLDVTGAEHDSAHRKLQAAGYIDGPLVCVCPGARWETKVYPARHFASVLDAIAAEGIERPVLVGGPDLAAFCDEIVNACARARPVNLCARTDLRELAALLDLADLMVTCDSGPMHIAAAQGTPTLAVFGSTDPVRTGPFGQLEHVARGECELMPCLKRRCPGMGHKCMRDLEPAKVAEKALALLRRTADKGNRESNLQPPAGGRS